MKTGFYTIGLSALIAVFGLVTSCTKTEQNPRPDERDKFVGLYNATQSCSNDTTGYVIDIQKQGSATSKKIRIGGAGLYNIGFPVEAVVTGNRFVVPIQQYKVTSNPPLFYYFSGDGLLNDSVLTVNFLVEVFQDSIPLRFDQCKTIGNQI